MIKKIKNLKLSITPEQVKNEWNEVKSVRNRLLQNSDWIFTPDNNLEESIVLLWTAWRKNIRRVDEFTEIDKALQFLQDLQDNSPPIKYKNNNYHSLESYKQGLVKLVSSIMKDTLDSIHVSIDCREIVMEKFEEAEKFLAGNIENTMLIDLEAAHLSKSQLEVAEQFIKERHNYFLKIVTIETVKNKFLTRIENVETIQQCDTIRDDLQVLGTKIWI
jgi:hypothetical protein